MPSRGREDTAQLAIHTLLAGPYDEKDLICLRSKVSQPTLSYKSGHMPCTPGEL